MKEKGKYKDCQKHYSSQKYLKKNNLYGGLCIPIENVRTYIHFNFLKKFNPNARVGV